MQVGYDNKIELLMKLKLFGGNFRIFANDILFDFFMNSTIIEKNWTL